jgi:hypothetical protein
MNKGDHLKVFECLVFYNLILQIFKVVLFQIS